MPEYTIKDINQLDPTESQDPDMVFAVDVPMGGGFLIKKIKKSDIGKGLNTQNIVGIEFGGVTPNIAVKEKGSWDTMTVNVPTASMISLVDFIDPYNKTFYAFSFVAADPSGIAVLLGKYYEDTHSHLELQLQDAVTNDPIDFKHHDQILVEKFLFPI